MSLFNLKKIVGAVKGGVAGFAAGGWGGAAVGAVAGYSQGNPAKTKNAGRVPQLNTTKGKVQLNPNLSPVSVSSFAPSPSVPASTGGFSASGLVRQSAFGNASNMSAYGSVLPVRYADFSGGGASGSFFDSKAPPMYINPTYDFTSSGKPVMPGGAAAQWLTYYTKKGTPRQTTKSGRPRKRPHMNPMNPRAAHRAIRRIRGARKLLQRIERSLPKARSHSRPTRSRAA